MFFFSIADAHRTVHKALSQLVPIPESVLLCFDIKKLSHESLGITIIGGIESQAKFIYVKSVDKNGVCSQRNTLEIGRVFCLNIFNYFMKQNVFLVFFILPGDQIIMVNEHNLRNVTHEEAVQMLRESKTHVKIMVSRLVDKKRKNSSEYLTFFLAKLLNCVSNNYSYYFSFHTDLNALWITQEQCVFSNTLSTEEPAVLENKQIWGKII